MKRIFEALKAARKIEIVLLAIFLAMAALIMLKQDNLLPTAGYADEVRLERLLEQIDGAGKVSVMLSGEEGAYGGCVAIAQGANDMRVVLKMQRAIQAAMDIPPEKIEIIPSGG